MDNMDIADIKRDVVGTVMMYDGVPYFIQKVNDVKELIARPVADPTATSKFPYNSKLLKPITGRIGMISDGEGSVVYATRLPARKFFIGLSSNTLSVDMVYRTPDMGQKDTLYSIKQFALPTVADALLNKYPSVAMAYKIAKQANGAMPFDKQFAVDHTRAVYYKTGKVVGHFPPKAKTVQEIQFKPEFDHLRLLLENNYEKTVRTFTSK